MFYLENLRYTHLVLGARFRSTSFARANLHHPALRREKRGLGWAKKDYAPSELSIYNFG
jgi:hypothetical protein